ncbi:unnamed protein product [Nippostrongylus brasiliensis]|uniref:Conserved domain protein n=1 Tax=Nippostrongylus brasiliensis TaxID=27835 RepID=A0A0N4XVW1_NIPBR|nr:unnamed protein product [Nippostrongylus brasiliensis]
MGEQGAETDGRSHQRSNRPITISACRNHESFQGSLPILFAGPEASVRDESRPVGGSDITAQREKTLCPFFQRFDAIR